MRSLARVLPVVVGAFGCHDYEQFSFVEPAVSAGAGGEASEASVTVPNQADRVSCAAANDCALGTSYCCVASGSASCVDDSQPCSSTRVECDGPEDCGGARLCCADASAAQISCRLKKDCELLVCGDQPGVCQPGTSCKPSPTLGSYNVCSP